MSAGEQSVAEAWQTLAPHDITERHVIIECTAA